MARENKYPKRRTQRKGKDGYCSCTLHKVSFFNFPSLSILYRNPPFKNRVNGCKFQVTLKGKGFDS